MTDYNGEGFYQTRHFNIFLTASVSECTWDAALRRWETGSGEGGICGEQGRGDSERRE
jgi:hypothetical protein